MLILLANSCKEVYDEKLTIFNNTENAIYACLADEYNQDTSYVYINYNPVNDPQQKIDPFEEKVAIEVLDSWEYVFENITDTVAIYFFDAEVIESVPWDTVRNKYMVLDRYDYSYQDFVDLDWTITYP